MELTGNKQDWSRIYALFKLLGDGCAPIGNRNGDPTDNYQRLIRLRRQTLEGTVTFTPEESTIKVVTPDKELSIQKTQLLELAEQLLLLIKGKDEQFGCDQAEILLNDVTIYDFVSEALEGEDFDAVFFDDDLKCEVYRKIRVRSNLSNLYLVAANRASNFKYDIIQVKLSSPEVSKINGMGDDETGSITRINEVERLGGKLKYSTIEGKFFLHGLQLIDMQMPRILSEMTYQFYTGDNITVRELTQVINNINPFKVKDEVIEKSRIYEFKIRQFLFSAACGMKPTKTWRGNGLMHTWLFINKKGQMSIYDPQQKEDFEKFLWFNTRFSIPNETKNKFGEVEKENGQWLMKLNLEIRFI